MNREDIIRMAVDAGIIPWTKHEYVGGKNFSASDEGLDGDLASLIQFAGLVASAEREKVARWHIGSGYTTGHGDTIEDLLVELEWQVRESEREACAKVCEEYETNNDIAETWLNIVSEVIRARGQA